MLASAYKDGVGCKTDCLRIRNGKCSYRKVQLLEPMEFVGSCNEAAGSSSAGPSDDDAAFYALDLCCGLSAGGTVVMKRLGGRVTWACDKNGRARVAYQNRDWTVPIGFDVSELGRRTECCDIAIIGLPCSPFSKANTTGGGFLQKSHDGRSDGDVLFTFIAALKQRKSRGHIIPCFIIEEVNGFLLDHLTTEETDKLGKDLGYTLLFFIVSAGFFSCATKRERLICVGFYDPEHAKQFEPPQAWTEAHLPLGLPEVVLQQCPRLTRTSR